MWVENSKAWLKGTEQEEKAEREGEEGHEGAGNFWRIFVRSIQHIRDTGNIPRQMPLSVVV